MTKDEFREIVVSIAKKLKIENHLGARNFRKDPSISENAFKFTTKVLSLSFIQKLQSEKKVKNVFFNASFSPPGGSMDSISMRYKVYVEFIST